MRILFDSKLSQFKTPFGVLRPGEVCTLHIQIPVSCRTEHVELLLLQEDGTPAREVALSRQETGTLYECFGAAFSLERAGLYFYCFRVTTKNEQFRLYKQGNDTNMEAGDFWQLSCVEDAYPVPEALRGAVMYQIFPDRFYQSGCCNCAEKLQPYWVHEDKSDVPVYLPDEHGEVLNNDFYGGNLNGICEKLPYLQELGVEILYLNPIFMAFSTHRYDTYDYKRIDPMLGTEADFSALCSRAHALGMKVVLDGVFSHVGSRSPYFQSAISNPDSPYRDWFQFKHYPDVYESWWGITTLPCVDKMNESYIRYIIEDEDSVLAHWLRLGADGYRLDVVDELPDAFLARLRKRLRELKPDAILIGEVWEDASNKVAYGVRRRYLTGRQLDSVMNYPWQKAILRYVRGEDGGEQFGERIMTIAENYPSDVLSAVMNILSTHDTPRALTALVDPTDASRAELARRHMDAPTRSRALHLLRMAAFLQFMLPGAPCIYYGDEAGMDGYRDPFNRKFYPWGAEDEPLQAFYTTLARLKKESPALRRGDVTVLEAGGGRLLFLRRFEKQTFAVCCNRAAEPWRLPSGGRLRLGGGLLECSEDFVVLDSDGYCVIEK